MMKTSLMALVAILLSAAAGLAAGQNGRWRLFDKDPGHKFYCKADTMRRLSDGKIQILTKIANDAPDDHGQLEIVTLIEIDCERRTYRGISMLSYDREGNLILATSTDTGWHTRPAAIPHDSPMERLLVFVRNHRHGLPSPMKRSVPREIKFNILDNLAWRTLH